MSIGRKFMIHLTGFILIYCFISIGLTPRAAIASTVSNATSIPSGAKNYKDHAYYYYKSGKVTSWEAAAKYCKSRGGHLATITTKAENGFLFKYLRSIGANNAYFGFSDAANEGKWHWVTGESAKYTNWHSGEPNNESINEDYGMFYWKFGDGTWNDGNFGKGTTSDDTAFICEWDNIVTNIRETAKSQKSMTVYWDAQPGATNYQVQYRLKGDVWNLKTVTKAKISLKNLKPGKSYQFMIRAYSNQGFVRAKGKRVSYGAWSGVKTIKTYN